MGGQLAFPILKGEINMKDFTAFDNERKGQKILFTLHGEKFVVEDDFNVMLKLMAMQKSNKKDDETITKMFKDVLGDKQYKKLLELQPSFQTMMEIVGYISDEIGKKVQGNGDSNSTPSV